MCDKKQMLDTWTRPRDPRPATRDAKIVWPLRSSAYALHIYTSGSRHCIDTCFLGLCIHSNSASPSEETGSEPNRLFSTHYVEFSSLIFAPHALWIPLEVVHFSFALSLSLPLSLHSSCAISVQRTISRIDSGPTNQRRQLLLLIFVVVVNRYFFDIYIFCSKKNIKHISKNIFYLAILPIAQDTRVIVVSRWYIVRPTDKLVVAVVRWPWEFDNYFHCRRIRRTLFTYYSIVKLFFNLCVSRVYRQCQTCTVITIFLCDKNL